MELPDSVAAQVVALVDFLGIFAIGVGDKIFWSEGVIGAGVRFAGAKVEDVAVAVVPVVKISAEFEAVGIEAVIFFVERAGGVGAGEEAVGAG